MGAAGDTTLNMIFKAPEFLLGVREAEQASNRNVAGFLFSSGGNDILGKIPDSEERVLSKIVRKHEPGEQFSLASAFNEGERKKQFDFLEAGYAKLIADIRAVHPKLPLFFHSYDKVWPFNPANNADDRKGIWVQPPLTQQGIGDFENQRLITTDLINQFKSMLQKIANSHSNVHYMDTGQPLGNDLGLWHDEIHPNNKGYEIVSNVFGNMIADKIGAQV